MPHHFLNTFVGILHILYLQAEDSNRKHPAATRDPIFSWRAQKGGDLELGVNKHR